MTHRFTIPIAAGMSAAARRRLTEISELAELERIDERRIDAAFARFARRLAAATPGG